MMWESEEDERSMLNNNKRISVHSDWSDLISVDEEAEYRRINKKRSEPNVISVPTTLATSITEHTQKSSVSPVKKTVKNIVLVPYTPKLTDLGKLASKITICHKHYSQSSCSAIK